MIRVLLLTAMTVAAASCARSRQGAPSTPEPQALDPGQRANRPAPPVGQAPTDAAPMAGVASGTEAPPPDFARGLFDGFPEPDTITYRQESATVSGPLDPDVVLRIVTVHGREVEFCFRRGVAEDRSLAGRVEVQANINDDGSVLDARALASTLADARVDRCIATALSRWRFPDSDDGQSVLTLAFVLDPAGG